MLAGCKEVDVVEKGSGKVGRPVCLREMNISTDFITIFCDEKVE